MRGLIESHVWDNENISEQRDWAIQRLAEATAPALPPPPQPETAETPHRWHISEQGTAEDRMAGARIRYVDNDGTLVCEDEIGGFNAWRGDSR